MRRHTVMGHPSPRMILWRRLREPDVTRVTGKPSALQSANHRIAVANLAARRIDEVGAPLHLADEGIVEQVLGFRVQRSIDGNHIADAYQRFDARVIGEVQFFLDTIREPVPIRIVKLDVKGFQPPQNSQADAPGPKGTHFHRFEIVGAGHTVRDVPAAVDNPFVGRDVVTYQREGHHYYVFGHADAVAVGDLRNGDAVLDGSLKIDVIRTNAGRNGKLELLGLFDPFRRQVGGPERLRDDDFGVGKFAFEDRVRALLIGGYDEGMAQTLEEFTQPEFAGDTAEKLARLEIDMFGRRGRLPAWIRFHLWNSVLLAILPGTVAAACELSDRAIESPRSRRLWGTRGQRFPEPCLLPVECKRRPSKVYAGRPPSGVGHRHFVSRGSAGQA